MHPDIERLRDEFLARRQQRGAVARFLLGSWRVSRATAQAHSALAHSWRRRALWRAAALPWLAGWLGCSPSARALWLTYALQQFDLYLHLGLNRPPARAAPYAALPVATECTLVRAYAAAALLTPGARVRRAFALGAATDVLDGYLARRRGEETCLGALLDGEYDAYLLIAAARVARSRGTLHPLAAYLIWLRFGAGLLAGTLAFFALPRPPAPASTRAGKAAGLVQAALLFAALSERPPLAPRRQVAIIALATAAAVAGQARRYHATTSPSGQEASHSSPWRHTYAKATLSTSPVSRSRYVNSVSGNSRGLI